MRYDAKLNDIVQTAVMLNQLGDSVMSMLDSIEKRLRKGGVATEVWLDEPTVGFDERSWMVGLSRFEGRFRLAVREKIGPSESGYATPLKHAPRLLRLRAATLIGPLLDALQTALLQQVEEASLAAARAEQALGCLPGDATDDSDEKE